MWRPKRKRGNPKANHHRSAIRMKGSVHGWTRTKTAATASLPASRCSAFWTQPQSVSVASPASELRDAPGQGHSGPASRKSTTPRWLRTDTCFSFYAVMVAAGQVARNAREDASRLCSAGHTVAPLIHFNAVVSMIPDKKHLMTLRVLLRVTQHLSGAREGEVGNILLVREIEKDVQPRRQPSVTLL